MSFVLCKAYRLHEKVSDSSLESLLFVRLVLVPRNHNDRYLLQLVPLLELSDQSGSLNAILRLHLSVHPDNVYLVVSLLHDLQSFVAICRHFYVLSELLQNIFRCYLVEQFIVYY